MAKSEKPPVVSKTMERFVAAHVQPQAPTEPPEKADQSYTIYVSKSEADKIAEIQKRAGNLTRQAVLRMLVQAGLEQFGEATGWWKEAKRE